MNNEIEILEGIKKIIMDKEPNAKIYLYGSRARGTAKPDSDWDILILLNRDKITDEIDKDISYSLYDLELEKDEIISPIIYTLNEWQTKYWVTPFYHNVMKEGKLL